MILIYSLFKKNTIAYFEKFLKKIFLNNLFEKDCPIQFCNLKPSSRRIPWPKNVVSLDEIQSLEQRIPGSFDDSEVFVILCWQLINCEFSH